MKIIYECVECQWEGSLKELKIVWDIEPFEYNGCSPNNEIGVCPECESPRFFINIFGTVKKEAKKID